MYAIIVLSDFLLYVPYTGINIANTKTTSHGRASRTIPREVFLTTELTIDGFGADGDSAHESIKEHKNRLFFGVKTAENC